MFSSICEINGKFSFTEFAQGSVKFDTKWNSQKMNCTVKPKLTKSKNDTSITIFDAGIYNICRIGEYKVTLGVINRLSRCILRNRNYNRITKICVCAVY